MLAQTKPRFYGRRKGRSLSLSRQELMEKFLPPLRVNIPQQGQLDIGSLFNTNSIQQTWLEIGFGGGEHLTTQAEHHPNVGFIGCEPFVNGVASLLANIQAKNLQNVRIHPDDVRQLLKAFPANSIERTFILFPDPWPKLRHNKRRLIAPELIKDLERILSPGGQLIIATDDQDYCQAIMSTLSNSSVMQLVQHINTPPENWVTTRYEQRAQRLGNCCHYFCYQKQLIASLFSR